MGNQENQPRFKATSDMAEQGLNKLRLDGYSEEQIYHALKSISKDVSNHIIVRKVIALTNLDKEKSEFLINTLNPIHSYFDLYDNSDEKKSKDNNARNTLGIIFLLVNFAWLTYKCTKHNEIRDKQLEELSKPLEDIQQAVKTLEQKIEQRDSVLKKGEIWLTDLINLTEKRNISSFREKLEYFSYNFEGLDSTSNVKLLDYRNTFTDEVVRIEENGQYSRYITPNKSKYDIIIDSLKNKGYKLSPNEYEGGISTKYLNHKKKDIIILTLSIPHKESIAKPVADTSYILQVIALEKK